MHSGHFHCAGGKLAGMKLQFSLATLLVCMTVLGAVAGACLMIDVRLVKHHLAMTPGGREVEYFDSIPLEAQCVASCIANGLV